MKIGGKKLDYKPASEIVVFPREGGDIAIRANAVMERSEYDRLVKAPLPPKKRIKGGALVDNPEDPKYLVLLQQSSSKYLNWLIINSLCGVNSETKADEPIEWEIVDKLDPSTWDKWEEELKNAGFSDMERKRINNLVIVVNSLSDTRLDEVRESFLQYQAPVQEESSSPSSAPKGTPSGVPVNASA